MRQSSVCAPLSFRDYVRNATAAESRQLSSIREPEDFIIYDYGPILRTTGGHQNFTHSYNKLAATTGQTYSVPQYNSHANKSRSDSGWLPKPELWSETADVSLIMVEFNTVLFAERTEDAIFWVTQEVVDDMGRVHGYVPDYSVSPLACLEQLQFCNEALNRCTNWRGRGNDNSEIFRELDVNPVQAAVLDRLLFASTSTQIADSVYTRLSNALRAQDSLWSTIQLPLPANQWHIEVRSWFEEALALLQHEVQEYATGPYITPGSAVLQHWTNDSYTEESRMPYRMMCDSQLVLDAQGTISFSVLGMAILFAIGGFIVLLSCALESIVMLFRSLSGHGHHQTKAWKSDASLAIQQMLLEGRGQGDWDHATCVPTTTQAQTFDADILLNHGGSADADTRNGSPTDHARSPMQYPASHTPAKEQVVVQYSPVPIPQPHRQPELEVR